MMIQLNCTTCNKIFSKKSFLIGKNNFCSRSCSAKHNNSIYPKKRKKEKLCLLCTNPPTLPRGKYCIKHQPIKINPNKTLGELKKFTGFKSNQYQNIRDNARTIARNNGLLEKCFLCPYSKHVIACHIKSISSFPLNATISQINDLRNLIGLCSNHHWEFDHNLLSEEEKNLISAPRQI